jgi:ArsR family transcriptional regulator
VKNSGILPGGFLEDMAGALRVLGHPYRLRIVERLDLRGPAPGHALLADLGGAQGALSQHVARLRQAGVLRAERRGREVWYALVSPAALTILNCMRNRQREMAGVRRQVPGAK